MTLILFALACSSVIPETTSNPVDKLAGYLDVRLGQKVEGTEEGEQEAAEYCRELARKYEKRTVGLTLKLD